MINEIQMKLKAIDDQINKLNNVIAEKNEEIERLNEKIASLVLQIREKYKQGYRDGFKDWEDEH